MFGSTVVDELINVGKYRGFSSKKGKNHPIINIVSRGVRGENLLGVPTFLSAIVARACTLFCFMTRMFIAVIDI